MKKIHTRPNAPLLALVVLASACVEPISNAIFDEDADFLASLPSRELNTVHFEDADQTGDTGGEVDLAPPSPAPDDAPDLLAMTLGVSGEVNGFIEGVLDAIQFVREFPPTLREEDLRSWGPWSVVNLGGVYLLVEISRDGVAQYGWEFNLSPQEVGPWTLCISGQHLAGDPVSKGVGGFAWDLTAFNGLVGESALGALEVEYDNLDGVEFHVSILDYQEDSSQPPTDASYWYAEDDAGDGAFEYQFSDDVDETGVAEDIQVRSRWTPDRSLRSDAYIFGGDLWCGEFHFSQCWSPSGQLLFQQDSLGYLEQVGSEDDCAFPEAGYPEHL